MMAIMVSRTCQKVVSNYATKSQLKLLAADALVGLQNTLRILISYLCAFHLLLCPLTLLVLMAFYVQHNSLFWYRFDCSTYA